MRRPAHGSWRGGLSPEPPCRNRCVSCLGSGREFCVKAPNEKNGRTVCRVSAIRVGNSRDTIL